MSALPFLINHFISSSQGRARNEKFKALFPSFHALVKQHQDFHTKIMKGIQDSNGMKGIQDSNGMKNTFETKQISKANNPGKENL